MGTVYRADRQKGRVGIRRIVVCAFFVRSTLECSCRQECAASALGERRSIDCYDTPKYSTNVCQLLRHMIRQVYKEVSYVEATQTTKRTRILFTLLTICVECLMDVLH